MNVSDQEVQKGFDEVYNKFWLNYRNKPIPNDSEEWERVHTWAVVLMKKYPFMQQVVAEMMAELGQRVRRREGGRDKNGS